ncbi:MAG: hypothetical protein ACTHPS_03770 [Streptosporangiaceae bacterium]
MTQIGSLCARPRPDLADVSAHPATGAVRRVVEIIGTDRVIPSFTNLGQALEPAPAATPRPSRKRRRPEPGMRPREARPPPDPVTGTSPA